MKKDYSEQLSRLRVGQSVVLASRYGVSRCIAHICKINKASVEVKTPTHMQRVPASQLWRIHTDKETVEQTQADILKKIDARNANALARQTREQNPKWQAARQLMSLFDSYSTDDVSDKYSIEQLSRAYQVLTGDQDDN